jgi:hypothetical protein
MIPGKPGEMPSIMANPRSRIEIVTGSQDDLVGASVDGDSNQGIPNSSVIAVFLSHTDQAGSGGVHPAVCIATTYLVGDWRWRIPGVLPVELLILEVREIENAVVDGHGCSAGFVHPSPRAERRGGEILERVISGPSNDHQTA